MNIRGITRFTLLDYPKKISCVIYSGNCNFKCAYCHNPSLVEIDKAQSVLENKDFFAFLDTRIGKLDAVVLSGGEPTLQKEIFSFAAEIKKRGFLVKLDTNGFFPDVVKKLHENKCLDFIAIDYKSTKEKYNEITKNDDKNLYKNITDTISYVLSNKIDFEIRTTIHKSLLNEDDIKVMREELNSLGVKKWTLQQFNPVEILDEKLKSIPTYTDQELFDIAKSLPNTFLNGVKIK